jgi:dolichyl-phosphate beta-glucosyltransferase
MKLSVVIPVYNEKKRITQTLDACLGFFREQEPSFELLVVNDGSTDTTEEIVRGYAAQHPEVSVISYPHNQGKGYAVREGMRKASGDLLLFMDADLATPLKEYLKLRQLLEHDRLDLVIGSRVKEESDIEVHQPLYRRFVGRIFNLLVRTIALPGIKDSQCGFKLYTRRAYTQIAERQTITDFSFDVEQIFIARRTGLLLKEVGVKWRNDANTTVSVTRSALPMLINLFRIRWRHL